MTFNFFKGFLNHLKLHHISHKLHFPESPIQIQHFISEMSKCRFQKKKKKGNKRMCFLWWAIPYDQYCRQTTDSAQSYHILHLTHVNSVTTNVSEMSHKGNTLLSLNICCPIVHDPLPRNQFSIKKLIKHETWLLNLWPKEVFGRSNPSDFIVYRWK